MQKLLRAGWIGLCCLVWACASERVGPRVVGDAALADAAVDAALPDATVDATLDAELRDATVDAALPDAAVDATVDAATESSARPTSACGDDLNVDNGRVTPDRGATLTLTESVSGDLANPGTMMRAASELTIPIVASTRDYAGTSTTVTAGTLPATAYVPTGAGPYPLIVALPGFQANRTLYTTFYDHFASWGFVAVGVDTRFDSLMAVHDKEALEVTQVIDWLLTQSAFKDKIDATKITVAGHSKGGKVAFFAAALDSRVDLVIGWDPVNSGGGPCAFDPNCNRLPVAPNCAAMSSGLEHLMHAETLVIGAPPDALINPDANHNCVNFYRGAPSPAWLAVLNVGHAAWAGNNDAAEMRITKRTQMALLLTRFYGATGLEGLLPGGTALENEVLVARHENK